MFKKIIKHGIEVMHWFPDFENQDLEQMQVEEVNLDKNEDTIENKEEDCGCSQK